jgi:hypothetical protein
MQIHMQRRHSDRLAQDQLRSESPYPSSTQIFSSIRGSLYKNNYGYPKDNNSSYVHQKLQNGNNNNSLPFQGRAQSHRQQEKDSVSKISDDIRDTYETMHQIGEIRKMSKQFQSSSTPTDQLSYIMSIFAMKESTNSNTAFEWIKDYSASLGVLDNMLRNNKNIGFRGHICNKCFHCWIDPIYSNSEDLKSLIKSAKCSSHICDPKQVADTQMNLQDMPSKKNASENALINLIVTLMFIYWCYFPLNRICLRTEELTSPAYSNAELDVVQRQDKDYSFPLYDGTKEQKQQRQHAPLSSRVQREQINCNSINIDLDNLEQSHWAYRAINEAQSDKKSSIMLDGNEVMEFVKAAKGSYGIHSESMGGSMRHFLMYLSFTDDI